MTTSSYHSCQSFFMLRFKIVEKTKGFFWSHWYIYIMFHFFNYLYGCQAFEQVSVAKGDLVMIQTLLLSCANYFVIMLTRLTGLYHNQVTFSLTPNQKSWQLTKCTTVKWPIRRTNAWKVHFKSTYSLKVSYEVNLHITKSSLLFAN